MTGVLGGFGLVAAIVAVGYLLGRTQLLGDGAERVLSRLAFFVGGPALLFITLNGADVRELVGGRAVVTYVSSAAMILLYLVVARWVMRRPAGETVIGGLCSGYSNAGNLGIPIAAYALGGAQEVAPTLIFQLTVLAPLAYVALDLLRARGDGFNLRTALSPLLNPVLLSSFAGVISAVVGWDPPAWVLDPLATLGGVAVPAMLLAFGISLRGAPLPGRSPVRAQLALAVGLKSFVHPLLAWGLATVFALPAPAVLTAVVIASLPTAQNVFVTASRYDTGVMLARESVLATTVLAVPVVLVAAAVLG